MSPWDFINSINSAKKNNLIEEADNPTLIEKDYNAFLVNKSFSYFADTIWLVNMLNKYHGLDKKLQYEFLLYGVRPAKRYSKDAWKKKARDENLCFVKEYFNLSNAKGSVALSLLSEEQIKALKSALDTGGV